MYYFQQLNISFGEANTLEKSSIGMKLKNLYFLTVMKLGWLVKVWRFEINTFFCKYLLWISKRGRDGGLKTQGPFQWILENWWQSNLNRSGNVKTKRPYLPLDFGFFFAANCRRRKSGTEEVGVYAPKNLSPGLDLRIFLNFLESLWIAERGLAET